MYVAISATCMYMADSHESHNWCSFTELTDLVSDGFYLDKCIDLIEGFHAIHSFHM